MGPEFTGSLAEFQSCAPLAQLTSSQTPVDCRHLTLGGWSSPPRPERLQWTKLPLEAKLDSATPGGTFLVPQQDPGHLRIWLQGWSFRKGYGTNMESTQLLEKRHGERVKIEGKVPEKQAKLSLTLFKATKKSLAIGLATGQQSGYLTSQQEISRLPTSSNQKPQSYVTRRKPPRY